MAKQSMDFEIIPKLQAAISMLEDEMTPSIGKGLEATETLVTDTGVATLKKSFENTKAGIEECTACFKELVEVLHTVETQYLKARKFATGE